MYKGPFYFHQPAYGQFQRAAILLHEDVGDGIIVGSKTAMKTSERRFPDYIAAYQKSGKQLLIDTEQYNPSDISAKGREVGSRILLEPAICGEYVSDSLGLQLEYNCTSYIIPNIETPSVSPAWYEIVRSLGKLGRTWIDNHDDTKRPILLTISIPADYIADKDNRIQLMDNLTWLRQYVDGYYLNLVNIPEYLIEPKMIYGIFDTIFRLKRQYLQIVFSKSGKWIPMMFPLGLDIFGNGSHKSGQKVRSSRNDEKRGGGGHVPYYNIWSPIMMDYIKYPEEATLLHNALPERQRGHLYGSKTGYAPPLDTKPETVYHSKGYKQPRRLNHFSASQAQLAQNYRGKSFQHRVTEVQKQLQDAYDAEQYLGRLKNEPERGREKQVWLDTFNRFIEEKRDHLEELFDD